MADNNLNNAVAFLGTTLNSLLDASRAPIDSATILQLIPKRSLSGDYITGGRITNFASAGIKDEAKSEQLFVRDDAVHVNTLSVGSVKGSLKVEDTVTAKSIKVDVLEVKEIITDSKLGGSSVLELVATPTESLFGKGIMWKGHGYTRQFVFSDKPEKFFSTESIELAKEREFRINGSVVLSGAELGPAVVKSSLREVGRLKGLIVDGDVVIDQYFHFNSALSRLGIGSDDPKAALTVAEDGIEVILGTQGVNGAVGTFASSAFDIVTDNTSRINIGSSGNILLGNYATAPVNVNVHGKLAVGVKTIDPRVNLHVAGAIKFNERIHQYLSAPPSEGNYDKGSIVWNENPELGKSVGWVCVRAGTPGTWLPFGQIKDNG